MESKWDTHVRPELSPAYASSLDTGLGRVAVGPKLATLEDGVPPSQEAFCSGGTPLPAMDEHTICYFTPAHIY